MIYLSNEPYPQEISVPRSFGVIVPHRNEYLSTADIAANLTTDSDTKVLAASQGVALKAMVDAKADKSNTYTKAQVNSALALKADKSNIYTKAQVDGALAEKADVTDIPTKTSDLTNDSGFVTGQEVSQTYETKSDATAKETALQTAINAKQDILTFDNVPTNGSSNPVKSDGIYDALATKQPNISDLQTIRSGAAAGATAVQPAELSAGLATKQDTINDLATIRSGAAAGATAVQPAALAAGLATKQDTLESGVNIKTINNQSLLGSGNIDIQGGGSDPEAVKFTPQTLTEVQKAQARTNIEAASNEQVSQLEAKVTGMVAIPTLYTDAYLKTSDPVGTVVNINSPVNLATWMCYMGPCVPGDKVIVNGQGGLSPRLWAFVDKDYKILSQSAASVSATNLEITAPSDTAWIIVDDCSGRSSYLVPDGSISENTLALREQKSEIDNLNGMLYHDTDIEGRLEITLDEDERILAYRKPDGTKVENIGVETQDIKTNTLSVNEIEISRDGVDELIQDLKDAGFTGGTGDWSDASKLAIPMPRCAVINLTSSDGTSATWPVTKTSDFEYWMQFWDMQGNYFKKRVIFNAQGNSSMAMPKKNGAIDLCNDEWEGDDTFEVKFGDWIPQDSFHLKAYYADYFVGVAVVGYEIFDQMTRARDIYSQRDWIKYLLPSKETIGVDSQATDGLSDNLTMHNDARCFPDGFPVLVYLDGVFYGVYSWQLKKHRDNYQMNKSNANEIHLDGMISYDSIFEADGNLPWGVINGTTEAPSGGYDGIEVRNPKSLICVDGTKYDADTNRKELISATSPGYDPANANMVRTAQVRAAMEQLSTYVPALQTMESGGSTAAQIRAKIEECFDVESLIDYLIFGDTLGNTDGFRKNWQWMTWDGDIWAAEPYDLDALLGWSGWTNISPVLTNHYGNSKSVPTGWIIAYYADELESRYKQLRDSGILTKENIVRHLQEWVYRIGTKNFSKNHELWPYDREHYEVAPEDTRIDSIFRVSNWIEQRISYCDTLYNY